MSSYVLSMVPWSRHKLSLRDDLAMLSRLWAGSTYIVTVGPMVYYETKHGGRNGVVLGCSCGVGVAFFGGVGQESRERARARPDKFRFVAFNCFFLLYKDGGSCARALLITSI